MKIQHAIKSLPANAEVLIVITIAFSWFIYISTDSLIYLLSNGLSLDEVSDGDYYGLVLTEVILGGFLIWFLKMRGWLNSDFYLPFKLKDVFVAIGLVFLVTIFTFNLPRTSIESTSIPTTDHLIKPNLIEVALIVVVNSVYEEFFLVKYLYKALSNLSMILVTLASVVVRISYHTYQGPIAATSIGVMGLIFCLYYLYSNRLTPLVLCHGMINLLTLSIL